MNAPSEIISPGQVYTYLFQWGLPFHGYVISWRGKPVGWIPDLKDVPFRWLPGVVANCASPDEPRTSYVADGGDVNKGAEAWIAIDPEQMRQARRSSP